MKPRIQLALDFVNLDRAIKVAQEAADYVDILEAGTPLIKSEGLDAVRKLRKLFPDKKIVADMKIMDAGRVEVEAAAKAGADIVDVCAQASDATIAECVAAAANVGCEIIVDLIACEDVISRAIRAQELGADYVAVHTAIDEQMQAKTPFKTVMEVASKLKIPVAAAGGINSETAAEAAKAGAQIIIVGGAITKDSDPAQAARKIRKAAHTQKPLKTTLFKRDTDVRKILSSVSTSNLSDAMHRSGDLKDIKPINAGTRACGPAVTCRSYPGDWAKPVQAIDTANPGDIIVITTGGVGPAVWGELATESAKKKKISAVVVDGAVRDTDEIRKTGFPVYSKLICPTAGEPKGFGEINVKINVGETAIKPGDWIVCDGDGVVVIPKEKAVEIANRAQDILERENRIRAEIRGGGSLGRVMHLLRWEKQV